MRKELEDARQLIALVRQREITKREQLCTDRQLFEQRTSLRQVKRNLPEQYNDGDEDILINQKVREKIQDERYSETNNTKPQKRKPLEIGTSQRTPATQLRLPPRPDGRSTETDLVSLQDVLAEKENDIEREINSKIAQHVKWNEGYVDMTRAPLTPPLEESIGSSFRTAVTEYLPTPPASVSSDHSGDAATDMDSPSLRKDDSIAVRYASSAYDGLYQNQPSFRRRIGRGGRLMIDRRGMHLESREGVDDAIVDRFKYDRDDDDDDDAPVYLIDPYDISSMRYRAATGANVHPPSQIQAARRAQLEGPTSASQTATSVIAASSHPRNVLSD